MDSENVQNDEVSDTVTSFTPTTTDDLWDGLCRAVPWHGNTYMILEKTSGRAITLTNHKLGLQDMVEYHDAHNRWLCVETNGYFGFQDPKTGQYIGHDGNCGMRAMATVFKEWEFMTPRKHPDGGYQLLAPHWWHTLRVVTVAEDGESLVLRQHGTTLWEFVKIPER
ncbi:Fc.00g010360.m01.CDS01 [Cosmosporella sp. VM-42]